MTAFLDYPPGERDVGVTQVQHRALQVHHDS